MGSRCRKRAVALAEGSRRSRIWTDRTAVLTLPGIVYLTGPPDHVSTLSGRGTSPYPASCAGRQAEEPATLSRFPVAFRPPTFASWSSIARWGIGPPLRSAYRPRPCRTPTGLSRSTRTSGDRGGCPLYPGDSGAHTTGPSSPVATSRITTAMSLHPGTTSISRGFT